MLAMIARVCLRWTGCAAGLIFGGYCAGDVWSLKDAEESIDYWYWDQAWLAFAIDSLFSGTIVCENQHLCLVWDVRVDYSETHMFEWLVSNRTYYHYTVQSQIHVFWRMH
jgi:hypothetical protein